MQFARQNNSQKWGNNTYQRNKFVLTIADMDIPLFPALRQKIVERMLSINNFTYKNPSQEYLQGIINWYKNRHIKDSKTDISQKDIIGSPSVLNAVYILIQNFSKKGDGILMLTPVFYNYVKIVQYLERKPMQCRLYNERISNSSRYDINFADLEEKAKNSKIMILCNPHNPTGRIWSRSEINNIVNICKKYSILIISDQILLDLTPKSSLHRSYSLINTSYNNVAICNSISKAFNAESLKGGYVIFKNSQIKEKYELAVNQLNLYVNEFALITTEIFYSKIGIDWLEYALKIIETNYKYLMKKVQGSLLVVSQLQSAFIIVVNFEGYLKYIERWYQSQLSKQKPSTAMVSQFLDKNGIVGNVIPYASQFNGIFTEVRFTIAIETKQFILFADKLISKLYEIEYVFREIKSSL